MNRSNTQNKTNKKIESAEDREVRLVCQCKLKRIKRANETSKQREA